MPTSAVNHPNPADLNAFGLGKVDPKSAETIEQHLQTCADCRQIVAESSGDSFLGRLRAAKPADSTQVPNHSVVSSPGSQIAPVSSTSPQSIPPELIGNPEYEIVRELGRGGMGVVYLARNTMMGRDEVLKVMGREVMARPGAADRFRREIQSAARLDHPNIVRAFSARLLGDLLVFSMEYVPGEELGALVKARGPLPIVNACYYTQQVANGLQHAHEKGMAHRDIKPANLIRVVEGKKHTVKVLDFGLAKLTQARSDDHGLTGEGRMLGTPDYIAPEQIVDAQSADIRADIYSLGCTLYFLLVGGPPFRATSLYELLRKHREEDPRAVNLVCTEVSAELAGVVAKMMAKDPARRYQTPADVAKALAPFVKPGSSVAKPQRSLPQLRSAKSSTTVPKPTAVEPAKPVVEPVPPSPKPMFPRVAPPDSPTNAWESLVPESVVDKVPIRRPPARTRQRPVWMWPAVAGGAMVMLLVLLAASGAFRMKTKDGVIVLENLPEDAEVLVDGETVTVTRNGEQATVSLHRGGPHKLEIVQGDRQVYSSDLTVNIGGEPVRVRVEKPIVVQLPTRDPRGIAKDKPIVHPLTRIDSIPRQSYKTASGDWKINGNELVQESLLEGCKLVFGDFQWKDYDFTCEAKRFGEIGSIALLSHVTGKGCNWYEVGAYQNTVSIALSFQTRLTELKRRTGGLDQDRWYSLRVQLRGDHCACFLDNQLVLEYDDKTNSQGAVGLSVRLARAHFRKFRVTDPSGKVLFEGLPKLPATADQWFPATESASASELHCLKGHCAPVTCVAFSGDGRQLLSGSDSHTLCLADDGKVHNQISPESSTIRLWQVETGKKLDCTALTTPWWYNRPFSKLAVAPKSSSLLSTRRSYYSNANKDILQLWDFADGKLEARFTFPTETGDITGIACRADGNRVIAVGTSGSIWEFDFKDKTLVHQIPGSLKDTSLAAITPDCRFVVVPRKGEPFAEIEIGTGKETGRWKVGGGVIRSLAFSPDSHMLVTGGEDGSVRVWDMLNAKHLMLVGKHGMPVLAVAISPDGTRALTGGEDWTTRLWDLDKMKELARFEGHTGPVRTVAFSPDGKQAASGSEDYTIRLWRLPTATEAAPKVEPKDEPTFVPLPNSTGRKPGEMVEIEIAKGMKMKFCWIPGGKARLGSPKSEQDYVTNEFYDGKQPDWLDVENESVRGEFTTTGFWLGKYTVTQAQWEEVMGYNPSFFSKEGGGRDRVQGMDTTQFPVETVSWDHVQHFLKTLNKRVKIPTALGKWKFALPNENEWEYACRGGTGNKQPFYFGDELNGTQANCFGEQPYGGTFKGSYLRRTRAVGSYEKIAPHRWGLCDMSGNVAQWCENKFDSQTNSRATRGGSWLSHPGLCRCASRDKCDFRDYNIGFRVALIKESPLPIIEK